MPQPVETQLKTALIIASFGVLVFFLMAVKWFRSDPAIQSIFFVFLVVIFTLGAIALDLSLFERKRNQSHEDDKIKKPAYHPNFRIWGVGMLTGIGATIAYLIAIVTLSLLGLTSISNEVLYKYTLLLSALTIAMVFAVWGIVRVCQGE
ncbi:MAG TPA: hypothetical protein VJM50_07190 [Pyrinomonadaceae bacterium]|nr:hypothetical protein [Pyrinomonadaceae bacterium]